MSSVQVDFILFGLTLLGVALLHRHTLAVALGGLAAITAFQLAFTGYKYGAGFISHGFRLGSFDSVPKRRRRPDQVDGDAHNGELDQTDPLCAPTSTRLR